MFIGSVSRPRNAADQLDLDRIANPSKSASDDLCKPLTCEAAQGSKARGCSTANNCLVSMAPLKRLALMAGRRGCPDRARPLVLLRHFMSTSALGGYWDQSSPSEASEKKAPSRGKERLASVLDAIHERKLPPELRGRPNAIRSETDIVNVVEQRIWQSMEEGQFENLPGKGKPLNLNSNPHADPADDTLYRILSRNGCAPEWVELNKDIRTKIAEWRSSLMKAWRSRLAETASEWQQESEVLKKQMRTINDMVFRYNLIVPFGRQMFGLSWEKELQRLEQ